MFPVGWINVNSVLLFVVFSSIHFYSITKKILVRQLIEYLLLKGWSMLVEHKFWFIVFKLIVASVFCVGIISCYVFVSVSIFSCEVSYRLVWSFTICWHLKEVWRSYKEYERVYKFKSDALSWWTLSSNKSRMKSERPEKIEINNNESL